MSILAFLHVASVRPVRVLSLTYLPSTFRFRMSPRLFARIADAVTTYDDWFQEKANACGQMGAHPYQKILAAIKMLATGCSADSLDAEFRMSASIIHTSLKHFTRTVATLFKQQYLRRPTATDIQHLLQVAELRGFPGMLGSLDCMHWAWEKCPQGWHGEHRGHTQKPTMILEAVVGPDLWFWHANFGLPGSLNDINVLHRSHLFDDIASGTAPLSNFKSMGIRTTWGTTWQMVYIQIGQPS